MPAEGVLLPGDALVTGHPLLPRAGPQLLPAVFNHDEALTYNTATDLVTVHAHTLVPGHGLPSSFDRPSIAAALGARPPTHRR